MGFKVKIEANDTIELGLEAVQTVTFETDTPNDSNARSTDLGMSMRVTGKILAAVAGAAADATIKLPKWALVPAEDATCYGKVTVDVLSGSKVVRQIVMDCAYVVDYQETFADQSGVGTFDLLVRQKKDLNTRVEYKGGFSA
jgi:hypothetical protein